MTAKETKKILNAHLTQDHGYYAMSVGSVATRLSRHEALHERTPCNHDHRKMTATHNTEALAAQFLREAEEQRQDNT
jgi:hypothetical protein